jgi:hypothetical protein
MEVADKAIWVLANKMKIMDEKSGRYYNSQIKNDFLKSTFRCIVS